MPATTDISFSLDQCTFTATVEPHAERPRILQHFSVQANHPTEGQVGILRALQIRRPRFRHRGELFDLMAAEHQELLNFASTLFDKFGLLRPELVENPVLKGTSVWGCELNTGALLYIREVRVEEKFRGQAFEVASRLVRKLVQSADTTEYFFAKPSAICLVDIEGESKEQSDIAAALFAKNHFRRVGRTYFVAYATDPSHASRSLSSEEDVETHVDLFFAGISDGRLRAAYPLHQAIGASSPPRSDSRTKSLILSAYSRDPGLVRQRDAFGFTLLHAAVCSENLPALEALLSLPVESTILEDLHARDNILGRTPHELCEYAMRMKMEDAERTSKGWEGHSIKALCIAYILRRRAEGGALTFDDFEYFHAEFQYVHERRWGCTCGSCTDGWLSARMRCLLQTVSEAGAQSMDKKAASHLDDYLAANHPSLGEARGNLKAQHAFQTLAKGFRAISAVLQKEGHAGIPTPANVWMELSHGRGGRFAERKARPAFAWAIYNVLRIAMDPSPLANGDWDDNDDGEWEEADYEDATKYHSMPMCANDLEFARVAQRCGIETKLR